MSVLTYKGLIPGYSYLACKKQRNTTFVVRYDGYGPDRQNLTDKFPLNLRKMPRDHFLFFTSTTEQFAASSQDGCLVSGKCEVQRGVNLDRLTFKLLPNVDYSNKSKSSITVDNAIEKVRKNQPKNPDIDFFIKIQGEENTLYSIRNQIGGRVYKKNLYLSGSYIYNTKELKLILIQYQLNWDKHVSITKEIK